jgi:uridylate kinase
MTTYQHNETILLKLSGEALQGSSTSWHDTVALGAIISNIEETIKAGVKVCIVIGGGNLFRGRDLIEKDSTLRRATVDYMGMLGTVMNALALQDYMRSAGIRTKIFSSIAMESICSTFCRDRALDALSSYDALILAGGTGNPFVSTDTLAAIRAVELGCSLLLKSTHVDGVYDSDPRKDKEAKKYNEISYDDVIYQGLAVMDLAAIIIAKENSLPIAVFDTTTPKLLAQLATGTARNYEGFSLITSKHADV